MIRCKWNMIREEDSSKQKKHKKQSKKYWRRKKTNTLRLDQIRRTHGTIPFNSECAGIGASLMNEGSKKVYTHAHTVFVRSMIIFIVVRWPSKNDAFLSRSIRALAEPVYSVERVKNRQTKQESVILNWLLTEPGKGQGHGRAWSRLKQTEHPRQRETEKAFYRKME